MNTGRGIRRHADAVAAERVAVGSGTRRQVLLGPETAPHFQMRRFVMEPGGGMPRHTNAVEHEQYVLSGTARIGIGEDVIEVREGDALFIPAGVAHWYETTGEEPFVFLCMVPNLPDHIVVLEED